MTWQEAYLRQAESDFRLYRLLSRCKEVEECHRFYYLQMATEKLAKAFQSKGKTCPYANTHHAFVRFLQKSKANPSIRRRLGYADSVVYCQYIDGVLPMAEKIQNLAPVGTPSNDRLNPEYPWENPPGTILVPAAYAFPDFVEEENNKTKLVKLVGLVSDLLQLARAV